LHVIEEVRGVEGLHGINLSLHLFLLLSTGAWLLMICGIVLAHKLGFPQFIGICLGSTVFLNGLVHIFNSLITCRYDAGVISGTVVFIPLGVATLISLRNNMPKQRYFMGIALGVVIQTIATILAA